MGNLQAIVTSRQRSQTTREQRANERAHQSHATTAELDRLSPDPSPRVMCRKHATDGQDCREQAVLVVWRGHEDQGTEFPPCNLNPQTVRRCHDFALK
jgi:hypothetical protein